MSIVATEELWHRLVRPFDPGAVGAALLGLPADEIHELADVAVCAGDQATTLIGSMPRLIRRLRAGNSQRNERCLSGIRGPVLWSETAAARSSTLGNEGVFVCSIPGRDYDVVHNRVLVSALGTIVDAGRRVQARHDTRRHIVEHLARVSCNTDAAARYLGHRTLAQVQSGLNGQRRSLRAIVSGRNATIYRPAADVLEKFAEPFSLAELVSMCPRPPLPHHELLLAALNAMEAGGHEMPGLRPEGGALIVGSFEYRHPRQPGTDPEAVAVLYNDEILLALDPLQRGIESLSRASIGRRTVVSVATTDEITKAILTQFN